MATTAICNSFKQELLAMTPHTAADVYKILLIKASPTGTYNASVTNVGTPGSGTPSTSNVGTDEVAASGTYTSGGATLSGFSATLQTSTGCLDFTSPITFTGATISASAAIIYNSSRSNRAVAVYDFGGTISSTAGTFTINLPAVGAGTSLVRVA